MEGEVAKRQRVSEVLDSTARENAARPALAVKREGTWSVLSWASYREMARQVARGLLALGVAPDRGVVLYADNGPEWALAHVGAILAGALPAGLYTSSSAESCRFILQDCQAEVVMVDTLARLETLRAAGFPSTLRAVVVLEPYERAIAPLGAELLSWDGLLRLGERVAEAELDARIESRSPQDTCSLVYTSGTTGTPKGVMLTHDNVTWVANIAAAILDVRAGEAVLSYLPLSHVAEQMALLHIPMRAAVCTWFAESLERLGANLREVRPHYFLAVPRVWEAIAHEIQAAGARQPRAKRWLARWARRMGAAKGAADALGQAPPRAYALADRLVFSAVRRQLGLDRCRAQFTSAAPISPSVSDFFLSLGLPLYELYGMSECTGPATISLAGAYRNGRVGRALPQTEVKIAEDGEICIRGRHVFAGYLEDRRATREAIDADGWLHSGDIGVLDADGYLAVTDRKKDLIVTSAGDNVAPQRLEGRLRGVAGVSHAMVMGDQRPYLVALLTLDPRRVQALAQLAGSDAEGVDAAVRCSRVRAYIQKEIDAINTSQAHHERVERWSLIPRELTVQAGELTPTLKVRRRLVQERFGTEIAELYSSSAE